MKVLPVEDNKLVSKIWRSLFKKEGVEVNIAESGWRSSNSSGYCYSGWDDQTFFGRHQF